MQGDKETPTLESALSIVNNVLVGVDRISQPEYRILVQVEAATLLWKLDRERSLSLLNGALERLNEFLGDKGNEPLLGPRSKEQRFRLAVLRRIARINPELVTRVFKKRSSEEAASPALLSISPLESVAIRNAAEELMPDDPVRATQLALETLSSGVIDWAAFLRSLDVHAPQLTEQIAFEVVNRLRNTHFSPSRVLGLGRYLLEPRFPKELQESFFLTVATRLRRDLHPDADPVALRISLETARNASQYAGARWPHWRTEFEAIATSYEKLFVSGNIPFPGTRQIIKVGGPENDQISSDPSGVSEQVRAVERLADPKLRDKLNAKLAAEAGTRGDTVLADRLLSEITDEQLRFTTTNNVYTRLAYRSVAQKDWLQAERYGAKIADPLTRTITLDYLAESMLGAGEKKEAVKRVYDAALAQLYRGETTEAAAKAYLWLVRSLVRFDKREAFWALNLSVSVLNSITKKGDAVGALVYNGADGLWIRYPAGFQNTQDLFDIVELIGLAFKIAAMHDSEESQNISAGIVHGGLHALSQLAIARAIFDNRAKTTGPSQRKANTQKVKNNPARDNPRNPPL